MQTELGYKINDIMKMSPLEFNAFIDSMQDEKTRKHEINDGELTTLDQAFPTLFTDPYASKRGK